MSQDRMLDYWNRVHSYLVERPIMNTAAKTFDPKKPVQTRSGLPARIICTDRSNEYPIVALITLKDKYGNDNEIPYSFSAKGIWRIDGFPHEFDLLNIPEIKWVNLFSEYSNNRVIGYIYSTESEALRAKEEAIRSDYITTVKIEI